ELLAACEADPALAADAAAAAGLREIRRDYDRATRLPTELVRACSEAASRAMLAWRQAREENRFAAFAPWLQRIVELSRERAAALGVPPGGTPYDVLLDEYEPGATSREVDAVFARLRAGLVPLLRAAAGRAVTEPGWKRARIPLPLQRALVEGVMERMGFDARAGRLDESAHPFCDGIGPGDTRLTTRWAEDGFFTTLAAVMHETGHALYEQNLPADRFGQPLGEAAGTAVHESQARLWENFVGRGRPFWEWVLPRIRDAVGDPAFAALTVDDVCREVGAVRPVLLRIEADEAAYNLHVMLRYDLERALLAGDLAVDELPGAWNERFAADFGVEVPDDARGCLQDVHWAAGGFGYFPTYALGNLYAGQLWEAVRRALPGLDDDLRRGEFGGLAEWLRANVHAHGRRFTPPELCERATGRPLGHEALLGYLREKLAAMA
ncbi:MAG: carboxypeptidase M32, partial [Longimicrobiaceae bacterium]